MNFTLKQKLIELPSTPGVYIFKDSGGHIIYIGKAKSLKNRVSSYFSLGIAPGTKTYALVSKITDMDFVKVETELEALILESELIKKHRPKYNIIQKDDKSYLFIVFRKITHRIENKPVKLVNIFTARESDLLEKDVVFGPYPDGKIAKEIIRKVRLMFPFKDCADSKFTRHRNMSRPCLYGQIGLCMAPCVGFSDQDRIKYITTVKNIKKLLSGKSRKIVDSLRKQMKESSEKKEYESAIYYRDMIRKFNYVSNTVRSPEVYVENPYLVDDLSRKALEDIVAMIPILDSIPNRIECYDISNISGKESVGSMVVAINGQISTRDYKRFKIKNSSQPNDYAMLAEVLERRLSHSNNSAEKTKWDKPDLIIVDGGKGQVAAVTKVIHNSGLRVCLAGLAKKLESIVYFDKNGKLVEARYSKDGEGMKLLIRLRDEAHRFAQRYHHLLREKKLKEIF